MSAILDVATEQFAAIKWPFSDTPWLSAFTVPARADAIHKSKLEADFDFIAGRGDMQRQALADAIKPTKLIWLTLEHKTHIVYVSDKTEPAKLNIIADAAIISATDVAVAFTTADCMPIVIASTNERIACAIHAGWRGLAQGIIETCLDKILHSDSLKPSSLRVWIGPSVACEDYEVGLDTKAALMTRPAITQSSFAPTRPGHCLANLSACAMQIFKSYGLLDSQIDIYPHSTAQDLQLHSLRRDGDKAGRMATVVCLSVH